MAPTRKARIVNKQFSYIDTEASPVRHGENSDRRSQRKKKLSDTLGPQWSKEELEQFYKAYRKHGKDWKKVGAAVRNRTIDMVEALYSMNRAYLSLPEGTASVAGLIAMMTDHYCNLAGSDSEQESNDGAAGTSRRPQKRALGKIQPKKSSRGAEGCLPSHSPVVASSYDCLPVLKKRQSGGTQPRVVGKRTPRFRVSYTRENINVENHFSPARQGLKFNGDADEDEVAHEVAITLAEVSQRRGSLQSSRMPKRTVVGGSDMDEDCLEGTMETDSGDFLKDKRDLMKTDSLPTFSRKGRRIYRRKLEVDSNGKDYPDEIRETCSGTQGQIVGVIRGKSDTEVSDAKNCGSSSQVQGKRSKRALFRRDEDSAFEALQTLADMSLLMPASTNDNAAFGQIKEASNEVDESESLETMVANHQREKRRLMGVKTKVHHSIAGSEQAVDKISKPGNISVDDVNTCQDVEQETHQSVGPRKKQKTSENPEAESHMSESQEAETSGTRKKSTTKGKRSSSLSASPKLFKHLENSSSSTADPRKEDRESTLSTVDVPIANQVDVTTKVRSRLKTKPQKYMDMKLSDKTLGDKQAGTLVHDRANNLKANLSNCFSNHLVRRWCQFEWFYSALDYPWFAKREFVEYLIHVGLGHVPRLTRVEWGVIRNSLGKPRRFSEQFVKEEKEKLNNYRDSVRTHYTQLRSGTREGLPTDLAKPLSVGQRVIAIHPKTREIHDGRVLTVDHNRCHIEFGQPELGVEFVMDIECMPLNPLENMPTSLARPAITVDKFFNNFNELKMNGHTKDHTAQGYIKFSQGENLENITGDSHMLSSAYPLCNLLKPGKVASEMADSQTKMGPKENATDQHTTYSQPCSLAQIQAKETDVQVVAELNRVLGKKDVLVAELGLMHSAMLENSKDGECTLMDSEPFQKQYAAVVSQIKEANERVSSALYSLRQRNTYQGNLSLTWPMPIINIGMGGGVLGSSNGSEIDPEELESPVNEIIESSRTRAHMMVNAAVQAYSSMKGGGNSFDKIEEAIDYVNDQLRFDDSSILSANHGNMAAQEQFKSTALSSLQPQYSPNFKTPSQLPSEFITKCVATMLMIQKCTERQFPPEDVAQVLDLAVASLQPCCSQNLAVYADIEKYMLIIKNQILGLVPT